MAVSNMSTDLNPEDALNAAKILTRPAEEFGNDPNVEAWWAFQASKHMEVYFNLLCSVDPLLLKLTRYDDEIYSKFRETFPDLKIDVVQEKELKSEDAKEKWRPFCEIFKDIDDYNFGTMLRLDSCREYSDENTLLVPRIQFYAIEIARNREGCNNKIRFEYKTTESTVSSLLCFLQHGWGAHTVVRLENGSSSRGDISVFIKEPACEKMAKEMCTTTVNGWPLSVKACKYVPPCRIQVVLDRPSIIQEIISEVCNKGKHYGNSQVKQNTKVLIVSPIPGDLDSLTHLRMQLLSLHLLQLLRANGYEVFVTDPTLEERNVVDATCEKCNLHEMLEKYEQNLTGTYMLHNELLMPYKMNQPILLKKGEKYTKALSEAIRLEHLRRSHICQEPGITIHIVPETHHHFQEQVGFLWNQIQHRIQVYIIFGKVFSSLTIDDYQRNQMKLLEEAWEHRCSSNIRSKPVLDVLLDTAIKFKFLSVGHSSPVHVDVSKDSKMGIFVQYNCARLATIFQRFKDGRNQNIYHTLPSIENVDYTLLKQEEWQLLYNYVLPFPQLVSEVVQNVSSAKHSSPIKTELPLHKVSHMLQHLVKEVSQYYSKKQILVDCRSDLMAARLSAIQAVQTVIHNALWLLHVTPLECM